jgi:hypothetical protein
VVLEVNRESVADVGEFQQKLAEAKKGVLMLVRRGETTLFVAVQRPADEPEQEAPAE